MRGALRATGWLWSTVSGRRIVRRLLPALLACGTWLLPMEAVAQYLDMQLGQQLPSSYYRLCPNLERARAQRDLMASYAEQPERTVITLEQLLASECMAGPAFLTPVHEEPSIRPGLGWNSVHDPASKARCNNSMQDSPAVLRTVVDIPCTWVVQQARWYYVKFALPDGKEYTGWAEIFPTSITQQYRQSLKQQGAPP